MKVGDLYKWKSWRYGNNHKYDNMVCIYLGEDFIHRDDGVIVENHKIIFLGAQKPTVIDRSCLTSLSPYKKVE